MGRQTNNGVHYHNTRYPKQSNKRGVLFPTYKDYLPSCIDGSAVVKRYDQIFFTLLRGIPPPSSLTLITTSSLSLPSAIMTLISNSNRIVPAATSTTTTTTTIIIIIIIIITNVD
jgi:hypothetical protein